MAEDNGDLLAEDKSLKEEKVERTPDYAKLLECGLDEKVAAKIDEIYKTGNYFS